MRIRTRWLVLWAALCARAAYPQPASGPQFRVNTSSLQPGDSVRVDVTMEPLSGRFVVVWAGNFADDQIRMQRFSAAGVPLGEEVRVNTFTSAVRKEVRVTNLGLAGFVVVWTADTNPGIRHIRGQRFNGALQPLGDEFVINTNLGNYRGYPDVAADGSSNFVVVWQDNALDFSFSGIFGQRFSLTGEKLAGEFRVNTYTSGAQSFPSVARSFTGEFVVVWQSFNQTGDDQSGVYAQRFNAFGAPVLGEFRVATYTTARQEGAGIGMESSGNFVVSWSDCPELYGGGYFPACNVIAQRFSANGAPSGHAFHVNAISTVNSGLPVVSARAADLLIVWAQAGGGVHAHRYSPVGEPLGEEVRINTYTTGDQGVPAIASRADGGFVVAWAGAQGPDGTGIYAQKFCRGGDVDGSGAVNVTDILYLINSLFAGGPEPVGCADVNGDLAVNVSDVLYLINTLFAGGPPPV